MCAWVLSLLPALRSALTIAQVPMRQQQSNAHSLNPSERCSALLSEFRPIAELASITGEGFTKAQAALQLLSTDLNKMGGSSGGAAVAGGNNDVLTPAHSRAPHRPAVARKRPHLGVPTSRSKKPKRASTSRSKKTGEK